MDDVVEDIYVDEEETEMQPGDDITISLLYRCIRSCDREGTLL